MNVQNDELMNKHLLFLFTSLSIISNLFSQEINIDTEFSQSGSLYENLIDNASQTLAIFKKNDKCIVINYLGENVYKVKYKQFEGFVKSEYLLVNDDMIDLVNAYEDKFRLEALQKEALRKKAVEENIRKSEEERKEKARQDSIVRVREEEKKQRELQEIALKEQEAKNEIERQNSLSKNIEEEKKQKELQEIARKQQEIIDNNRKKDSINRIKQEEIKQLELQKIAMKQELINEKRREDSISKVIQERNRLKKIEETAIKEQEAINHNIRQDSINRIKQEEKIQMELQKAAMKQELINERRREDSIARITQSGKRSMEQEEIIEKKDEQLIEFIGKNNDNSTSERTEFRNTCHYVINEFDPFYSIKTIRTEPYWINENLNIELFKQGQSQNIFFNLNDNLGCASYFSNGRSYVKVILENNDIITIYHSWEMDCENFSLKGKLTASNIEKLKKSPIKSMSLHGTKKSIDITNISYREFFIDKLDCIE